MKASESMVFILMEWNKKLKPAHKCTISFDYYDVFWTNVLKNIYQFFFCEVSFDDIQCVIFDSCLFLNFLAIFFGAIIANVNWKSLCSWLSTLNDKLETFFKIYFWYANFASWSLHSLKLIYAHFKHSEGDMIAMIRLFQRHKTTYCTIIIDYDVELKKVFQVSLIFVQNLLKHCWICSDYENGAAWGKYFGTWLNLIDVVNWSSVTWVAKWIVSCVFFFAITATGKYQRVGMNY